MAGNKKIVFKGTLNNKSQSAGANNSYESTDMPEEEDEKKYLHLTLLHWENQYFNPRVISTIEIRSEYDGDNDSGLSWVLDIGIMFPPFHKLFKYATEELCNEKKEEFLEKLVGLGLQLV